MQTTVKIRRPNNGIGWFIEFGKGFTRADIAITNEEMIELASIIVPEFCVCAAVKASDGTIYRGHRHGHCIQAIRDEGRDLSGKPEDQGFITTKNRFVTREEGRKLQDAAMIPSADKDGYRGTTLFSEDLYQDGIDVLIQESNE